MKYIVEIQKYGCNRWNLLLDCM